MELANDLSPASSGRVPRSTGLPGGGESALVALAVFFLGGLVGTAATTARESVGRGVLPFEFHHMTTPITRQIPAATPAAMSTDGDPRRRRGRSRCDGATAVSMKGTSVSTFCGPFLSQSYNAA